MHFSEKSLNSRFNLGKEETREDAFLILKIVIGGAFYNRYIKASYKNDI